MIIKWHKSYCCEYGYILLRTEKANETVLEQSSCFPGHVGPPLPGLHIKLVDVPEMNFYAKDGIGEVSDLFHVLAVCR